MFLYTFISQISRHNLDFNPHATKLPNYENDRVRSFSIPVLFHLFDILRISNVNNYGFQSFLWINSINPFISISTLGIEYSP